MLLPAGYGAFGTYKPYTISSIVIPSAFILFGVTNTPAPCRVKCAISAFCNPKLVIVGL